MHAMHGLEAAEGKVRVDLGGGDVGVAEHHLHAAEIGAVLDHVRSAAVAQTVRACGVVGSLDEAPDPLAGERHTAQRKKEARAIMRCGFFLPDRADAVEVRATLAQVLLECLDGGAPEGHNALFVTFAANLHAAGIEREVADGERSDFRDAQAAGIEKLEDGAVAQAVALACGCEAARAARSSISVTSGSASDFGRTFQALGDSMLMVGSR
jgi:hypothetical protein